MINLKRIARLDWEKRWNQRVSLLFCSYLGDQYIKSAKAELGVGFRHILFFYDYGQVACYRLQTDTDRVGQHLALEFKKNKIIARKWKEILLKETDKLKVLLNSPIKNFIQKGKFAQFEKFYNRYVPLFIRINIVPDYLSDELLRTSKLYLEKARVYSEDALNQVDYFFKKLVKLVAKKINYNTKLLENLLKIELHDYFDSNKMASNKLLEKRQRYCALYITKEDQLVLNSKQTKYLENLIINKTKNIITKVKGSVAYPGTVKGYVRIVIDPTKAKDFNEGSILVTSMTNPEFMPLMKKAGAVVTDVGGILSHAAIVSRELQKPCIIGTRIATRVLKNGDLVEVNANHGWVRKIEK